MQSLRVLCQLGKYDTVINCISVFPEKNVDILHILDFAKSLSITHLDADFITLSQRDDSLACYHLISDAYRKLMQGSMEKHDYNQALCCLL